VADIEKGENPGTFEWRAPSENTDGSPIIQDLSYQLYRAPSDTDPLTPFYMVVGSLQREDPVTGAPIYEAPLDEFPEGRSVIALTAIDEDGDESALSNTMGFTVVIRPAAPLLL